MGKRIGIAVGVIILVAALVVCLVPLKTVAYTVTVEYQDTETYYVDEPYEGTKNVTRAVPLDYEVIESSITKDKATHKSGYFDPYTEEYVIIDTRTVYYPVGHVTVKNTDNVTGKFFVRFSFFAISVEIAVLFWDSSGRIDKNDIRLFGREYGESDMPLTEPWEDSTIFLYEPWQRKNILSIEPGQTATAEYAASDITLEPKNKGYLTDWDEWFWEYEVVPSTKIVQEQTTVTKYKQVEKERTVTKQRPETRYKKVTLLDYFLHY